MKVKKVLSLIMAMLMILSLVPTAFADGESSEPAVIENITDNQGSSAEGVDQTTPAAGNNEPAPAAEQGEPEQGEEDKKEETAEVQYPAAYSLVFKFDPKEAVKEVRVFNYIAPTEEVPVPDYNAEDVKPLSDEELKELEADTLYHYIITLADGYEQADDAKLEADFSIAKQLEAEFELAFAFKKVETKEETKGEPTRGDAKGGGDEPATEAVAKVVTKDGTTEYTTIEDAIAAWGPGKTLTLLDNYEVSAEEELNVPANATLEISEGVTLTVSGKVYVLGTLVNNGTINGEDNSVEIRTMVYNTSDTRTYEDGTSWTVKATYNGAYEGEGSVKEGTIVYKISINSGSSWKTDPNNGDTVAYIPSGERFVNESDLTSVLGNLKDNLGNKSMYLLCDVELRANTNSYSAGIYAYSSRNVVIYGNSHTIKLVGNNGTSNEFDMLKIGSGSQYEVSIYDLTLDNNYIGTHVIEVMECKYYTNYTKLVNVRLLNPRSSYYKGIKFTDSKTADDKRGSFLIYDCDVCSFTGPSKVYVNVYGNKTIFRALSLQTSTTIYDGRYASDPTSKLAPGKSVYVDDDNYFVVGSLDVYGGTVTSGTKVTNYKSAAKAISSGIGKTVDIFENADNNVTAGSGTTTIILNNDSTYTGTVTLNSSSAKFVLIGQQATENQVGIGSFSGHESYYLVEEQSGNTFTYSLKVNPETAPVRILNSDDEPVGYYADIATALSNVNAAGQKVVVVTDGTTYSSYISPQNNYNPSISLGTNKVSDSYYAVYSGSTNRSLTIIDGTFESTRVGNSYGTVRVSNGSITIKDGVFTNKGNNGYVINVAGGTLTIEGGTFSGLIRRTAGTLTITGGKFTVAPSEEYIPSAYILQEINETIDGVAYKYEVVKRVYNNSTGLVVKEEATGSAGVGTAEAISETVLQSIIAAAETAAETSFEKTDDIDVQIGVEVENKESSAATVIRFDATPFAIVKVDNVQQGDKQSISNDQLNGNAIQITLDTKQETTPVMVVHYLKDGGTEVYTHGTPAADNNYFSFDKGKVTLYVTEFSEFDVLTEEAVASITKNDVTTYYASLTDAVEAAQNGDTVTVLKNVDLGNEPFEITKEITLQGAETDGEKIKLSSTATGTAAISIMASNVTIKNLTIHQENTSEYNTALISIEDSGKTDCYSGITIQNVKFTGSKYGMFVLAKNLTIDQCEFSNQPSAQILLYRTQGTTNITNNTFVMGNVDSNGGMIYVVKDDSAVAKSNGTVNIIGNTATGGRALYFCEDKSQFDTENKTTLVIKQNIISDFNNKAIIFYTSSALSAIFESISINENAIVSNKYNRAVVLRDDPDTSGLEIDATKNYWGASNPDFTTASFNGKHLAHGGNINVEPYYTTYDPNKDLPGALSDLYPSVSQNFYKDSDNENLWHIANLEGLKEFRDSVKPGTTYKGFTIQLDADITMDSTSWTPINNFEGVFEGNNKTITGLTINDPTLEKAGLFGRTGYGAAIQNLTLAGPSINAKKGVGALAGELWACSVSNVTVTNPSIVGYNCVGGLAGSSSYTSVSNCSVAGGTITGNYDKDIEDGDNVGGLIGMFGPSDPAAGKTDQATANCSVSNLTLSGWRKVGGLYGQSYNRESSYDCSVNNISIICLADVSFAASKLETLAFGGMVGLFAPLSDPDYRLAENSQLVGTVSNVTITCAYEAVNQYAKMGVISGGQRGSDSFVDPTDMSFNVTVSGTNSTSSPKVSDNKTAIYSAYTAPVAQIGETKYASLAEAVAAVPTDGTATTITMLADSAEAATITIAAGKNIVLDLNGQTVSYTANANGTSVYFITNKGTLTVKDTNANADGMILFTGEPFDNGYSKESVTVYNLDGTLNLQSGTIKNATAGGLAYAVNNSSNAWGKGDDKETVFNMTGGVLSAPNGDAALRVYQNCDQKSDPYSHNTVNISGGTILDTGIFLDNNIYQANANTTGEGIRTSITISGGTINGLIDLKLRHLFNTSLNITGGTFTNAKLRVRKQTDSSHVWGVQSEPETGHAVTISGGNWTFSNAENAAFNTSSGWTTTSSWTSYIPYTVTGGTYSVDPSAYVAPGYEAVYVENAEEGNVWIIGEVSIGSLTQDETLPNTYTVTKTVVDQDDPETVLATMNTVTVTIVGTEQGDASAAATAPEQIVAGNVIEKAIAASEIPASGTVSVAIDIVIKAAEDKANLPSGITADENTQVVEAHPEAIVKVNGGTPHSVELANSDLAQDASFTFGLPVTFANGTPVTVKHYGADGALKATFQSIVTGGKVPVTVSSFSYFTIDQITAEAGKVAVNLETGTQYETLAAAIEAATTGDTVALLQDIQLHGTEAVIINKVGTYVIDGAGHSITPAEDSAYVYHRFMFGESGWTNNGTRDYTLQNLTISGFTNSTYFIRNEGNSLTLDNCTITGNDLSGQANSRVILSTHADLTLKNCTITNNKSADSLVDFNSNASGNGNNDLSIDNCLFEDNTCGGNAIIKIAEDKSAAVQDSSFTGNTVNSTENGAVVYLSRPASVTGNLFKENEVNATGKEGVIVLGSSATDSAITGNAFVDNTLGTTASKYATIYAGANCNLNNNYWGDGKSAEFGNLKDVYDTGTHTITYTTYATEYAANTTTNGATVSVSVSPIASITKGDPAVTTYYASLADAIAAVPEVTDEHTAQNATTIVMIANSAETAEMTIASNKNIVLDLNGKTVSYTSDQKDVYFITNNGTLTIQDTSTNANGKITMTATPDTGYSVENVTVYNLGGTLNLKSGTIENLTNGGLTYAVNNSSNAWGESVISTFNMTGGVVSAPNGDASLRVYQNTGISWKVYSKNYVNISGGTITAPGIFVDTNLHTKDQDATGYAADDITKGAVIDTKINITGGTIAGLVDLKIRHPFSTELNISGGDFTNSKLWVRKVANEYGKNLTAGTIAEPTEPMVNISGGKFAFVEGKAFGLAYDCGATSWTSYTTPYCITGGIYNITPPAQFIATGYQSTGNTDVDTNPTYPIMIGEFIPTVTFLMTDSVGKILIQGLDDNVHVNVFETWNDGVNNRPNIRTKFTQNVVYGGTATKPTNTPYYDYGITQPNNGDPKTFTNADSHAYTFDGWATEDGELYDFTTPVTSNLTLHPRFSATGTTITISTEEELLKFAREVALGRKFREQWGSGSQTVKLANDITLTSNWTPVAGFEGIFDGNNKTISGLVINTTEKDAGFFSGLNSHTVVKDLTFAAPSVTSTNEYVGVLAGSASSGESPSQPKVSNVNVTGTFSVSGMNNVGALIGQVNANVQIEDCDITGSNGTVTASGSDGRCVGGLLGNTIGKTGAVTVEDCSVSGVTVTGYRKIGGLIGQVQGNLTCTDASVSNVVLHSNATTSYAKALTMGGMVGIFPDSSPAGSFSGTVSDVTMTGPENIAEGKNYIMGLVSGGTGDAVADAETKMKEASMTFNVVVSGTNTRTIETASEYAGIMGAALADPVVTFLMVDSVGKLLIQGLDDAVHHNVYDTWNDGVNDRPNIRVSFTQTVEAGGTATKPANTPYYDYNMTQPNNGEPKTFTVDDSHAYTFDGWATEDGELYDFTTPVTSNLTLHPRFSTTGATITISTEAELLKFAREVALGRKFREQWGSGSQTVQLANDITLTSNWTPVAGFEGIFDGNNMTISGLVINTTENYAGFFSGLNNHTVVKDLTFDAPSVTSTGEYVGVLAGSASSDASSSQPKVSNVNVTGTFSVSGMNNVGALIGQVNANVQIEDCNITGSDGTVTASGSDGRCVGGLLGNTIGKTGAVTVKDCSVSGVTVTGYRKIGGLIGQVQGKLTCTDASVSDVTLHSSATTSYEKDLTMGGLVGIFPDSFSDNTISGTVSDVTMSGPESISGGKNYVMGWVSGGTGNTVAEAETKMTNANMTFNVAASITNTRTVLNSSTYAGINGISNFTVTVTSSGNNDVDGTSVAMTSGGGSYDYGTSVTVKAYSASGYTFVGWYDKAGYKLSSEMIYEYTVRSDNNDLVAVYKPATGSKFKLLVTGSKFTVTGYNAEQRSRMNANIEANKEITIKFTGTEKFLYWINSSNKVVSTSAEYKFRMVQDTELTAVYSDATSNEALVVFTSATLNAQVITSCYYNTEDTIEYPPAPASMGKSFSYWTIDGSTVASEEVIKSLMSTKNRIVVYPVYDQVAGNYTVTVNYVNGNGELIHESYTSEMTAIGTGTTLTAPEIGESTFSYWVDENGNILAYTTEYYVRPTASITLKAVYEGEKTATPKIVMTDMFATLNGSKYRVSFTTTRSVPDGYTLDRVGMLYIRAENLGNAAAAEVLTFDSENVNVKAINGATDQLNSTHTMNINTTDPTRVFYARGFLVVTGPNGTETIYTDEILSGSYNSIANPEG